MLNKQPRHFVNLKNLKAPVYMNFITIDDEDYFNEKYPNNSLIERIQAGEVNVVLDIFWRLIDDAGKRMIRDVKLVRWDGMNEIPVATDNPVEKLRMLISGADEITEIMEAIFGVRLKSNPDQKENEKKKKPAENP